MLPSCCSADSHDTDAEADGDGATTNDSCLPQLPVENVKLMFPLLVLIVELKISLFLWPSANNHQSIAYSFFFRAN